jgi:hypothetical protein
MDGKRKSSSIDKKRKKRAWMSAYRAVTNPAKFVPSSMDRSNSADDDGGVMVDTGTTNVEPTINCSVLH